MKTSLTQEDIEAVVRSEQVYKLGAKTTAIVLTLKNGFEIVATSACVDPANYDQIKGAEIAQKRAYDKVWELEGYRLQCELEESAEVDRIVEEDLK